MTMMRALVLEKQHELAMRDIELPQDVGPGMAKIRIHNHTSGTKRYSESLTVVVDSRNEPERHRATSGRWRP